VVVDFYRQVGYLPEALVNYLALLGWALDDQREFFTREELIQYFSLEAVNKAPASFDPQKLWAFQDRYMRALPIDRKIELVLPYVQKVGWVPEPCPEPLRAKIAQILQAAGDRIKVAGDILDYGYFFVPDDRLEYDPVAVEKRLRIPGTADRLRRFAQQLERVEPFEPARLETLMHEFIQAEGIKLADIIHALRVAVTGTSIGLGMFDALAILGRQSCLARIHRALPYAL